jgi:hypothetical protein
MKEIELNAAAHRAIGLRLLGAQRASARITDAYTLARNARQDAARKTTLEASKTITLEVGPFTYGFLCAAGVVHDRTPEQCAAAFLNERVTEWSNRDFILED